MIHSIDYLNKLRNYSHNYLTSIQSYHQTVEKQTNIIYIHKKVWEREKL